MSKLTSKRDLGVQNKGEAIRGLEILTGSYLPRIMSLPELSSETNVLLKLPFLVGLLCRLEERLTVLIL